MAIGKTSILIVDFLDSYTHNIPAFVREALPDVSALDFQVLPYTSLSKNDVPYVLNTFHGVILSPGPGTVDDAEDLGEFTPALLSASPAMPIYGICLGFQAICNAFGGRIQRLSMPHHGLISDIYSATGKPLGKRATRYHSLEVVLDSDSEIEVLGVAKNFDDPSSTCLMEIRHRTLPFWGVQYHPESVYSHGAGCTIHDFLYECRRRNPIIPYFASGLPHGSLNASRARRLSHKQSQQQVAWQALDLDVDLLDLLGSKQLDPKNFVLLDSSSKAEWDILSASPSALLFQYSLRKGSYTFAPLQGNERPSHSTTLPQVWEFLEAWSSAHKFVDGPETVPFWGGFVGYLSYELGLAQLGLDPYPDRHSKDVPQFQDIQMIWSTETILFDKANRKLYLVSLNGDTAWIESMVKTVTQLKSSPAAPAPLHYGRHTMVHPAEADYVHSIQKAQEEIKAGNSYELCLTALSKTSRLQIASLTERDESSNNADDFRSLRKVNPAAFMSLMQLDGVEFMSASPEEFLSYDAKTKTANMKPIKGTLPKKDQAGNPIALADAEEALHTPKVIAENLMIVDLVRNDLARVSDKVTCPNLLWVEEIETMYQLVSTIEAEVNRGSVWDLIKCAFPPGSMTGAPKRRSCQILQDLEGGFRGLYSGIVGYFDVRGHCRTSVSIRNAAKYPGETEWRVGAGGAITNLSDPLDEWRERQLKANSICRTLVPQFEVLETVLWDNGHLELWDQHVSRLLRSLHEFNFSVPSENGGRRAADLDMASPELFEETSKYLTKCIRQHVDALAQPSSRYRLSIRVDVSGAIHVISVALPTESGPMQVAIRLDPNAIDTNALEPFVSHKTTYRDHYTSARQRAGVEGRDETLMFKPVIPSAPAGSSDTPVSQGSGTDLLTEGSYTNVAVFDEASGRWWTPRTGFLPGIMRDELIRKGEIVVADIERRFIRSGMKIKLFNSVRGSFEGVVA